MKTTCSGKDAERGAERGGSGHQQASVRKTPKDGMRAVEGTGEGKLAKMER